LLIFFVLIHGNLPFAASVFWDADAARAAWCALPVVVSGQPRWAAHSPGVDAVS
jgi:primosomal replication protein N